MGTREITRAFRSAAKQRLTYVYKRSVSLTYVVLSTPLNDSPVWTT